MPRRIHGLGLVIAGALIAVPVAARAQEPRVPPLTGARVAADAVAATDLKIEHDGVESGTTLDLLGGWRLADSLEVLVRPVASRDADGEWHGDVYQLALRYGGGRRLAWRLETGYLPSPVGISPLESRADANPLIAPITAYTARLPEFEAGTPRTQLSSPLYPLAAQLTVSTSKWDARAAVLESSLARVRPLTGEDKPPRAPQIAFGGGITPVIGLRLGASMAHGRYARARETADPRSRDRMATILGADADWSAGYTRVYGDVVRTAFDRAAGRAIATALTVTAVRTLSPRWFVAGRAQRLSTSHRVGTAASHEYPEHGEHSYDSFPDDGTYGEPAPSIALGGARALSLETAAGYRLTPQVTFRAGYLGYRGFSDDAIEHHATCSVVWSQRWR